MAHGQNARKNGHPRREYHSRRPGQSYAGWGGWFKLHTHRLERRAAGREERRALDERE